MKKIAVIPCPAKDPDFAWAKKAVQILLEAGACVLYPEEFPPSMQGILRLPLDSIYAECDAVVGFGGDGSLINQALQAAKYQKALLGCNMGKVGYLAEVELDNLHDVAQILDDRYMVEERMVIEIEHNGVSNYALNDAVISRGARAKISEIGLGVDNNDIGTFRSDGLILATPTGSTAYSLSAGGSVIDPTLECIAVTPVCPHQFGARPMIFSASSVLNVENRCSDERSLTVSLDGNESFELAYQNSIFVKKAELKCRFIRLKHRVFCHTLRKIKKY